MTGFVSAYSVGIAICIAAAFNTWRQRRRQGGLPLPPGPTGLPFVGSVLSVDACNPWLSYEEWGKQYGGLVYANMLGRDFLIINSVEVARDLLLQRSANYSDRPYIPANELFGMDFNSGLLPYGNKWRLHRKLFNTALNKKVVSRYRSISLLKARQLIENLLDKPEDFAKHCKTYSTATVMATIYGYDVAPKNDPFVTKVEHLVSLFKEALTPERAAILLAFPFLAYIPSWIPGGGYKQMAAECRVLAKDVVNSPVEYVMENSAAGTAVDSVVHSLLGTQSDEEYKDAIKAVAASAFLGGAETNDAALQVFILAMVLHPDIQVKAREEIDRVVGMHRLPDFEDRPHLPYVEAVYRECFRWRPAVPSALPHMTVRSETYQGLYIPKGAIVLTNIWAMAHDRRRFDNPEAFIPERHLTPAGMIMDGVTPPTFSFGRRSCPGKHLADQIVWGAIATMLATLCFAKARDEFGNEINIKAEFMGGLSSTPKPFACSITPRSSFIEDLVRTESDHS